MSATSTAPATFALDYAKSNLNSSPYIFDSRLVKVSAYLNRVKILSIYNDMINKLFTDTILIHYLDSDSYNGGEDSDARPQSTCDLFKIGLLGISKERGLTSMYNYIKANNNTICVPK